MLVLLLLMEKVCKLLMVLEMGVMLVSCSQVAHTVVLGYYCLHPHVHAVLQHCNAVWCRILAAPVWQLWL